MQNAIVVGLMLGTLSLLWWAALVFYFDGDYYEIPKISLYLIIASVITFAYSLRGRGARESAERWYRNSEDL